MIFLICCCFIRSNLLFYFAMNAREFLDHHGKAKVKEVCKTAKTTYAYFTQLATGNRRPSPELARALAEASDNQMTLEELLFPQQKTDSEKAGVAVLEDA